MGLYTVLAILIVGCCLILICFRIIGEKKFRKEVQKLVASADIANDELEELYLPTHFLEEQDIEVFRENTVLYYRLLMIRSHTSTTMSVF